MSGKRNKKPHHCTGCRNWQQWRKEPDEKCCTCCTGSDGARPGNGPVDDA